jgi:hypothetical protein
VRHSAALAIAVSGVLHASGGALAQVPEAADRTAPPSVSARRASGPITVDGRLDEPTWSAADTLGGLRQREPLEGEPASEATVVRVLYDDENLYLGILAHDSSLDDIVARVLERDGLAEFGLFGDLLDVPDDMVAVVLDTYHDRRNAFLFATNPVGNQTDALIENEGQGINEDWDGVWDVAARRHERGWSAEIAIPFRTLRFSADERQTWGFNVARVIKRKNEEALWSSWGRDNGGLFKIARAGVLDGLEGLRRGANLQIEPYVLARASSADRVAPEEFDDDDEIEMGGDAKWGITPNVTLDLTVNTDFAQVEADVEQINLTRFSLFFPEKREFFLENAGIFEFGIEGFGPPPLLLFFSRRIGIADGREVPLLGGARVTGRAGRWSIGALDVVTGKAGEEPRSHWSVVRVRRNVLARGQVGGIVTHQAPVERDGSTAFGVDFSLLPTNEFLLTALVAGSVDPADPPEPFAADLVADYTGDFWGWRLSWYMIGEGMRPAVGFVRRPGVHRVFGTLRQRPRPGGLVRSVTIRENVEVFANTDGTVEDRIFQLQIEPRLETGDQLRVVLERRSERLEEPFALRPELVVPAGEYGNTGWTVSGETTRERPVWLGASYAEPGFFDGRRRELVGELGWTPSPHLALSVGWSRNEIETPHGDLATDLGIVRIGLARSTRLRWDTQLQYNGEDDELGGNLRLHWIWSPGSDFYVVANLRRDELGDSDGPSSRTLVVKLTRLVWF